MLEIQTRSHNFKFNLNYLNKYQVVYYKKYKNLIEQVYIIKYYKEKQYSQNYFIQVKTSFD